MRCALRSEIFAMAGNPSSKPWPKIKILWTKTSGEFWGDRGRKVRCFCHNARSWIATGLSNHSLQGERPLPKGGIVKLIGILKPIAGTFCEVFLVAKSNGHRMRLRNGKWSDVWLDHVWAWLTGICQFISASPDRLRKARRSILGNTMFYLRWKAGLRRARRARSCPDWLTIRRRKRASLMSGPRSSRASLAPNAITVSIPALQFASWGLVWYWSCESHIPAPAGQGNKIGLRMGFCPMAICPDKAKVAASGPVNPSARKSETVKSAGDFTFSVRKCQLSGVSINFLAMASNEPPLLA